ncbi:uncharacterized protein LOC114748213 [Neltuma alba]|uniref:uncharacterized protein LOC114748213 n=1 Tax=Neltuma alba TaxID=207710 RepID=UPI0010A549BD|nr:uncharacterized protein LOC114748213 [Prosopis alba]
MKLLAFWSLKAHNSGGCDDHEASLCNHVQNCNSTAGKRAKNRKLFVPTSISTTHTTASKKAKMIENNKNARVKWAATSWKQHEELVGIAEMDYTAARRKPPIHN